MDKRVQANGFVNIFWVPDGGLAKPGAPLGTEMAAALDLSPGVAWEGLTVGATGTNEIDDRGILDSASTTTAGSVQYGASISYFYPKYLADANDDFVKIRNTFKEKNVLGYLIVSLLQNPQHQSKKPVAGDWVSVYKVMTDSFAHDTEGEDSYKFTLEYLPQGLARTYALVTDGTEALEVSAAPTLTAVGDKGLITAELFDKSVTQGCNWSSSNSEVVSVSPNGVVVRHATGPVTITVDHPSAAAPKTVSIT